MKLHDVFAVLKPGLSVETVDVSPNVYQTLDERFDGFKGHVLVSLHEFESDWPASERHPAGFHAGVEGPAEIPRAGSRTAGLAPGVRPRP